MTKDVNIKETIEDKKSWFNIKRYKIGNVDFDRPAKSLDVKELSKKTFDVIKAAQQFKLFEVSKVVRSFQTIKEIYAEDDDSKINDFFHKKGWLADSPTLINFTFNFNPYGFIRRIDDMSGFFDQYYQFSKVAVFVPNIRKKKIVFDQNKKRKNVTIINANDYLIFVDSSYGILDTKNNKPIFVPISLRMSLKDIAQLAQHYLKKEYYYYWFDFEGKSVNENSLARIYHFLRIIRDSGNFDKTICYFTNIKREIISNPKESKSPASDILASIAGANIIGVNREPRRMIEGPLPPPTHKARIFNAGSYYYVKTSDSRWFNKERSVSHNSMLLDREFASQSKSFLHSHNLEGFLQKKEMLINYRQGAILKHLISKSPKTDSLRKWF
ncbi:MAG: hypothetical protein QXU32_12275 [Nitrososphaerales archaeon]